MIYPNPSDEVLRSAHLITLYDPQIPDWNLNLVDTVVWGKRSGVDWIVVDIPVDSRNPDAVQFWQERVGQIRAQED